MSAYAFMGENPWLTVILVAVVANAVVELVKALRGENKEDKDGS